MIFLLANTLACVTFAVLVNISDKRKVKLGEVFHSFILIIPLFVQIVETYELVTVTQCTNQYFTICQFERLTESPFSVILRHTAVVERVYLSG